MCIIEDITVEISPNRPVNRISVEVVAQDVQSRQTIFALNANEDVVSSSFSGSFNGSGLYIFPEVSEDELSPCEDTPRESTTASSATLVDSENENKIDQVDMSDTSLNCSFLRNNSFNPAITEDCAALHSLFSEKPAKLAVSCRENGSLEHIGRIDIRQGVVGSVVVVEFHRAIPNSTYIFSFEIRASDERNLLESFSEDFEPLSKQVRRLVKLRSIPAYHGNLVLRVVKDDEDEDEDLIVNMYPLYHCTRGRPAGAIKEFRIPFGELPDIHLKRSVDIEIYRSKGLREVPLTISNSSIICHISPGLGRSSVARYQMEFDAIIDDVDDTSDFYQSVLCEIEILHGPIAPTELLLDSHFLADCSVTLCEDGVTSILHAVIPPQKVQYLSSLRLRFERHYPNIVGAIYIPRFKDENGPSYFTIDGSRGFTYCIHTPAGWSASEDGHHFECVDRKKLASESMVLQLPNRFPPSPRIRDAKYSLLYRDEVDGLVTVTLELRIVFDSSTVKVGQEILNVAGNGFWGRPEHLSEKLTRRALTSYSFDSSTNRSEVFLVSKSWKRDIDVSFKWRKQIFNRGAKWMFYAPIPQINQDNIDSVTVELLIDASVPHCAYIKSENHLMKLKNDKITLNFMGCLISDPILCISRAELMLSPNQLHELKAEEESLSAPRKRSNNRRKVYVCAFIVIFTTISVLLGRDYFGSTFQDQERINEIIESLLDY